MCTAIGDVKEPFCHLNIFSQKNNKEYKRADHNVSSSDWPWQCGVGVQCSETLSSLSGRGWSYWLLCPHVIFIQKAIICPSLDYVGNRNAVRWLLCASSASITVTFSLPDAFMMTHFEPTSLMVYLNGTLRYTGVSTEFASEVPCYNENLFLHIICTSHSMLDLNFCCLLSLMMLRESDIPVCFESVRTLMFA